MLCEGGAGFYQFLCVHLLMMMKGGRHIVELTIKNDLT